MIYNEVMIIDRLFKFGSTLGYAGAIYYFILGLGAFIAAFFPELLKDIPYYLNLTDRDQMLLFMAPSIFITRGITYFALIYFGIRERNQWCWYILLVFVTLNPISGLIFEVQLNLFPTTLFHLLLGIPAVALMGPYVFSKK